MDVPYFFQPMRGNKGALKTIFVTACIVAVVDGLAAVGITLALSSSSPVRVFQYIASGLLGTSAFSGGLFTAAIGLICHFFIALVWTTLFFIFHRQVSNLLPQKFLKSILYGIIIWTGMNLIVVPLSRVPSGGSQDITRILIGIITLILAAGLPMAHRFDQYYLSRSISPQSTDDRPQ